MTMICPKSYLLMKKRIADNGCWLWAGEILRNGYGRATINKTRHLAHRFSYEQFVGNIPEGYVVDHLCNTKQCVHPAHLRACTQRDNLFADHSNSATKLRKQQSHCIHGHELTDTNVYRMKCGGRACRSCRAIWSREYEKTRKSRRAHA